MDKPLSGEKIAVLVANGFNEQEMVAMQRMTQKMGAKMSIISMTNGLVNSWNENGWGLNFAADKALNEALAADFSMLVMPSGAKSAEKLQMTAHTRRFVAGFMDMNKPVVAIGEAMELLAFAEKLDGRHVSASEAMMPVAMQAAAKISEAQYSTDSNLMTVASFDDAGEMMNMIEEFLVADMQVPQAA